MERFAPRYDPRALTFLQMATACVGFTVIALARGELEVPHGATVWGALLVTGIFAGALGYLIATWVQARTTAARAALVFTLEAPFAALFGVAPCGRGARLAGWLGCAVMMCGIVVAEPAAPTRCGGSRACGRPSMTPSCSRLVGSPLRRDDGARPDRASTRASRRRRDVPHDRVGHALVTGPVAAARGEWDIANAWPFVVAGLLAPGISQILFTFAVRDAGASRTSVTVGTAPLVRGRDALVFLGEPLVAGSCSGAALIVTGGVAARERPRRGPSTSSASGSSRARRTIAFASRDTLVRWLATDVTDVEPGLAAFVTMLTGTTVVCSSSSRSRALASTRRARCAFAPGRALLRALVHLSLRGVLPRPRVGRLADRRDRVALGRHAVVARPAEVRARGATARRWARRSSSPAAC